MRPKPEALNARLRSLTWAEGKELGYHLPTPSLEFPPLASHLSSPGQLGSIKDLVPSQVSLFPSGSLSFPFLQIIVKSEVSGEIHQGRGKWGGILGPSRLFQPAQLSEAVGDNMKSGIRWPESQPSHFLAV